MESSYILLSLDFVILALSAGCIGLMNLSKNAAKKGYNFSYLAPDILDEKKRSLYHSLRGGIIEY